MKRLLTVGTIAARLGQPLGRVRYVLETRNLRPCATTGNAYVYSEEVLETVRAEIAAIAARKAADTCAQEEPANDPATVEDRKLLPKGG